MAYEKQTWVDKTVSTPGTRIIKARMDHIEQGVKEAHDLAERARMMFPVSGTATIPVTPSGGLVGYRVLSPGVTLTAPDFSTIALDPGVYILENAPGGWVVYEVAEGEPFTPPTGPILLSDDFAVARPDIYVSSTPVGGAAYVRGLGAPCCSGSDGLGGSMQVLGGQAFQSAGNGAGAFVAVTGLDWSVEVEYDVSSATPSSQIRVGARGNHQYPLANREQMPAQLIVRNTGVAQFEPFWNGSAWASKELATGQPQTGTARLDVQGSTARCYINDVLIGTETLDVPQQIGSHVGFGTYTGGRVTGFTATRIGP